MFCGVTCPLCHVLDAGRSQQQPAPSGSLPRPPNRLFPACLWLLEGKGRPASFFIISPPETEAPHSRLAEEMLPPAACTAGPRGLVLGGEEKGWLCAPLCPRHPSAGSHVRRDPSKHGLGSPLSKPCLSLSNRSAVHAGNTGLMVEQERWCVPHRHCRQGSWGLTFSTGLCHWKG